jgi:hypothetical protein
VAAQRHPVGLCRVIGWWARRIVLAAAAVMATPAASRADGVGSDGWRVLTAEDATTTSRCIGRATDLICAAETALGCTQRIRRGEVCRRVGMDDNFRAPPGGEEWLAYRLVRAGWVDPRRLAAIPREEFLNPYGYYNWLRPRSRQVWFEVRRCRGRPPECDAPPTRPHRDAGAAAGRLVAGDDDRLGRAARLVRPRSLTATANFTVPPGGVAASD